LILWFLFYVDWWSGSWFIPIDALVRVLYRLVLWFVFYFDWWCGPRFVLIGALARVVYRCLRKWKLHWDDADLTLQGAQQLSCLKTEPTSWRPWEEANRDVIPRQLQGPSSNTHSHNVLSKVYYSVRIAICKQGWATSCLYFLTAVCLKPPSSWVVTHHRVFSCRRFEWTW